MRRLPHLIAALILPMVLAAGGPASAASNCASAADQSVYEVLALRTQMILLATKCGRDSDYNNNFIRRFQSGLQANDAAVTNYFRRNYGGGGQGRKDTFTTDLVNLMSQKANGQGAEFCPRAGLIVNEMNALRTMEELIAYAGVKDFAPAGTSMCPAGGRR